MFSVLYMLHIYKYFWKDLEKIKLNWNELTVVTLEPCTVKLCTKKKESLATKAYN